MRSLQPGCEAWATRTSGWLVSRSHPLRNRRPPRTSTSSDHVSSQSWPRAERSASRLGAKKSVVHELSAGMARRGDERKCVSTS